jgi:hypothetical protein
VGDKYAGQWVPSAFASHGIQFEQSARAKSDLYLDLLPLINSRSVELLEHPRLASELIGLERRTARSGRDSVDHSPGGHDDVANAVAGLCTGLYLDRRPALVRRENLLTENKPHPLPVVCRAVIVVLCIDKLGNAAVVFSAITLPDLRKPDLPRLLILDFFIEPSSAQLFPKTKTKALQLQSACHGQTILGFVPEDLVHHAHMGSLNVQPFPKELGPPEELLMSVSHHVNAEQVKLCEPAAIAAQTTTFHGALDLRAAEDAENPLRAALIYTAALTLDPLKERKL